MCCLNFALVCPQLGQAGKRGQAELKTSRIERSRIRTDRRGQTEENRQNRTGRTGLPAQHCHGSTAKTGHLEQNNQDKIAGTGQPEKESLKRTAQMGKENGTER
jgi:hypothetical protein